MEWKPIDTAPKDGSFILLFCKAHFGKMPGDATIGSYEYAPEIHAGLEEGFRAIDDECIPVNQDVFTHWMPLPDPPNSLLGGGVDNQQTTRG